MDAKLRCAAAKKLIMSIIAATNCHKVIPGLEPSKLKSKQSLSSQVGVAVQTPCLKMILLLTGVDVPELSSRKLERQKKERKNVSHAKKASREAK